MKPQPLTYANLTIVKERLQHTRFIEDWNRYAELYGMPYGTVAPKRLSSHYWQRRAAWKRGREKRRWTHKFYQFASVEVVIGGVPFKAFKSVDFGSGK